VSTSPTNRKFEVFGEYVLLKNLASGGMAEVFLARPAKPGANGRILVIKRILREIANDPIFIKMFRSEIRTILGFNHPHTIQLHDFGEIEGQPYIAMEYIEGKSLREITTKFTEKGEPIPVPTVLGLMAQAAAGLGYAHEFENVATGEAVNAVHRDISPHNLIVTYSGNLKVIDFGIAKAKNGIAEKTRAGQIKGKCGYLSPEQLAEDELDGRSDIFSLGIVTWELLTSQKLFQKNGDTELQIIKRIEKCEENIVAPSTVNPEVCSEVDAVVLKALQKDPANRYPSASAFQAALRGVMQKKYPHYTYGDTAQIMHALFETDMSLERLELREMNDTAQQILTADWEAKTQIVEKEKPAGLFSSFFRGFSNKKELPDLVELRVSKLETMLRQKAGFKHIALFAFYLVSIIGIKLDERYSLLDRFFLPAQAEMVAVADQVNLNAVHRPRQIDVARQIAAQHLAEVTQPTREFADLENETAEPSQAPIAAPVRRSPASAPTTSKLSTVPAPKRNVATSAPTLVARKNPSYPAITPTVPAAKPTAKSVATRVRSANVTAKRVVKTTTNAKAKVAAHSTSKKIVPGRSIASVNGTKATKTATAAKPHKAVVDTSDE
jgi:serine/threonine protein kinase